MEKRDEEVANERVRATTPRRASERACVHPPALAGWLGELGWAGWADTTLPPRSQSQEPGADRRGGCGPVGGLDAWLAPSPPGLALAFYRGLCPAGPMVRTTKLLPRVRSAALLPRLQAASTLLTHPPLDYACITSSFQRRHNSGSSFQPASPHKQPSHFRARTDWCPAPRAQSPAPGSASACSVLPAHPRIRCVLRRRVAASASTVAARRKYRIW